MTAEPAPPTPFASLIGRPRVDTVADVINVTRGFHLGNVITISTAEGTVVVDSTGGVETRGTPARRSVSKA